LNMTERKRYFIQQYMQQEYLHGGVGYTDAEKILLAKGFEPIFFSHHYSFSLKAKFSRFIFLIKTLFAVKKGAVVVTLFPVYAQMNKLLLSFLRRKKNVQFIIFVADIDGIKDGNEKLLKKEIAFLGKYSHFIVHNEKMKEWLCMNVSADCITSSIDFFDFLAKPFSGVREPSNNIVFAGNLDKSGFLEQLYLLNKNEPGLYFHLYGPGQTDTMLAQKNVNWHGAVKPYELVAKLSGSFGLLWDGESIDKPGGYFGHYMQYISHHKLSLYILSKLPILVPATAASAPLVEKHKIGLAINNLYEMGDKIKNLSPAEYHQMQINMQPLAEKISKGECLGNAIDEIMKWV
jgi:hypothetical protein